jgi:DNA-binding FadR family transcriptional regulator
MVSRSRTVEITGVRERTVEDHRAIVAALKKRDPEAAQQAMLQHLNHVEQGLLDSHPLATGSQDRAKGAGAPTKNLEVVGA